jgi:hypothetical protein
MNDVLGRIWKDVVLALFKVLSWCMSGETEKNNGKAVMVGILWAEIFT